MEQRFPVPWANPALGEQWTLGPPCGYLSSGISWGLEGCSQARWGYAGKGKAS